MTAFGRHSDRTISSLATEAAREALTDACIGDAQSQVDIVYYGNVASGLLQGQESVRGQHALHGTELAGVPLINVENACASGSTALNQAWLSVAAGQAEVAVALGAEKLNIGDKNRTFNALASALNQERMDDIVTELGSDGVGSVFMDIYARFAEWYMESSGATPEDFARVAVKNSAHGALNPKAQYGRQLTVEEVLNARKVSGCLTVPMCAPMSDGAAAAVVTTPEFAKRCGASPVRLRGSALSAGRHGAYGELVPATALRAFEMAGADPRDVDIVECHDAASPAELIVLEQLRLCEPGEAPALLRSGATSIGGRLPVNPSGGLQSKGHPLGATGLGQVAEIADQLRGRAGRRQAGSPTLAVAENAGGYIGPDAAVATVTILST
ncbi:Acetyl-CoA acetyltransferase [Amycolatopsis marina]|uniref:Acetyl-CoA acetyltransferase n=2 Tax=Amycolatopsis marina TaxID=490629 RepID=A0A1I0YK53_9PSEU|nr:Acetyl-CoA acetyltransferase [Amycolatopsis marina]